MVEAASEIRERAKDFEKPRKSIRVHVYMKLKTDWERKSHWIGYIYTLKNRTHIPIEYICLYVCR